MPIKFYIVGRKLFRAGQLQYAPTLTSHNPNPPITLESPVSGDITGTLSASEAGDTGSFTGLVGLTGTLGPTEATDTYSSTGTVVWQASLSVTEEADTTNTSGLVGLLGSIEVTEATDTTNYLGTVEWLGTLSVTESTDTTELDGIVGLIGTLEVTESIDTTDSTGTVRWNLSVGERKGTGLTGGGTDVTDPCSITGTVNVDRYDLVWCVLAEQTSLTTSQVGHDNLGNTYQYTTGALNGGVGGRCFWTIVTFPGTLTQIDFNDATPSTNNWVGVADVFQGPFDTFDKFPGANSDKITPYTCNATGTLTIPQEQICCGSSRDANIFTATAPNLKGLENTSISGLAATIGYQTVNSTDSVSPAFTGTAPTYHVLDIVTFKQKICSGPLNSTESADICAFTGTVVNLGTLSVTEELDTAAFTGSVPYVGTLEVTEDSDTASLTGFINAFGTLVTTEALDTSSISGTVLISGSLDGTEDTDTIYLLSILEEEVEGQNRGRIVRELRRQDITDPIEKYTQYRQSGLPARFLKRI